MGAMEFSFYRSVLGSSRGVPVVNPKRVTKVDTELESVMDRGFDGLSEADGMSKALCPFMRAF